MKEFDYHIVSSEFLKPFGEARYKAKLAHLYELTGTRAIEVQIDFGEGYGYTEAEARAKVTERVESWIKAQQTEQQ
jgi:hypothetical protein